MTIVMTSKHQITIPKKIAVILGLKKGTIFNIEVARDRIELIPLEIKEKTFSKEVYKKLDALATKEKGKEKRVTKKFIENLRRGKI